MRVLTTPSFWILFVVCAGGIWHYTNGLRSPLLSIRVVIESDVTSCLCCCRLCARSSYQPVYSPSLISKWYNTYTYLVSQQFK